MYTEIDSAELIIYEAQEQLAKQRTVQINITEVVALASKIEQSDSSVRVNLGKKSISHFISRCNNEITLNEKLIIIENPHTTTLKRVFKIYGPSKHTTTIIQNVKK
jgi:hypothetical protein